jgi:hypothetical protein
MIPKSLARSVLAIGLLSLLSACAVNPVVKMQSDFWSQTDRSVVVALATLPEAKPHRVGAQGLIDMAINEAMADDLTKTLRTVALTDSYGQTRSEVVKGLQDKGIKASLAEKMIDTGPLQDFSTEDKSRVYAAKDFRPLKADLGADRLLLFTVTQAGTQRSYYGFIPTSSPSAILRARGELIDLQTNAILWRELTTNTSAVNDPWDQPPEFKNVHAAVQKVIAAARKAMADKLFAGSPAAPEVAGK